MAHFSGWHAGACLSQAGTRRPKLRRRRLPVWATNLKVCHPFGAARGAPNLEGVSLMLVPAPNLVLDEAHPTLPGHPAGSAEHSEQAWRMRRSSSRCPRCGRWTGRWGPTPPCSGAPPKSTGMSSPPRPTPHAPNCLVGKHCHGAPKNCGWGERGRGPCKADGGGRTRRSHIILCGQACRLLSYQEQDAAAVDNAWLPGRVLSLLS